jgi:hypothetical protein
MARGNDQGQTGVIYLRIADGRIVETVEAGTEGAIKRTTKASDEHPNGREVWERRDEYVDGVITSMFHTEREYKGEKIAELNIRLRDKDEHYALKVNKGNRYWVGILSRLPNVNFQKSVQFRPYDFEGKDEHGGTRRIIGINLFQNGEKIDPAWSKTSPGDLPQGKQVRVNGKDVWDFEARDNYLLNVFSELAEQLRTGDMAMGGTSGDVAQTTNVTSDPPAAYNAKPQHIQGEDEESLPF